GGYLMVFFRYEIVDNNGKRMSGAMQAASEQEVRQVLVAKGFTVASVISSSPGAGTVRRAAPAVSVPTPAQAAVGTSRLSAPKKELAIFFRQLAQQMHAGIGLYQALTQLGSTTPNQSMKRIIAELAARVEAGGSLNEGMSHFPRAFPEHIAGTVAAGEVGGLLPLVLGDIALDYELALRASSRVIKGWSWFLWINSIVLLWSAPAIPMMVRGGFSAMESTGGQAGLQFVSVMMGPYLSLLFKVLIPITALVLLIYFGISWYLKLPSQRRLYYSLVLKMPNYGQASRDRSVASFTRILWRLQSAGVLPIKAWEVASRVPENAIISDSLQSQTSFIANGGRYSEALSNAQALSADDIRLLTNGEATGQLIDSLQRVAGYYEDAAMTSSTRANWFGLRIAIFFAILSGGIATIGSVSYVGEILKGVDKYFGTG
ncbi:MAG TPA: type II secretion system F family protein, partial [Armatimonadota bacterium]